MLPVSVELSLRSCAPPTSCRYVVGWISATDDGHQNERSVVKTLAMSFSQLHDGGEWRIQRTSGWRMHGAFTGSKPIITHYIHLKMNHRLAYLLFNTAVILGDLTAPIFADPSASQEAAALKEYEGSKASKNSKSGKAASSAVNIKPFKCTNQCIDARVGLDNSTKLLTDAIVECDAEEEGQEWIIHQEGNNIVRMESVVYPGMCIAVEHDHYVRNATTGAIQVVDFPGMSLGPIKGVFYAGVALDTPTTIDACTDGVVGLISSDCESTKWYSTGGQLLSLTCWKADFSTSLSVGDDGSGKCLPDVKSMVYSFYVHVCRGWKSCWFGCGWFQLIRHSSKAQYQAHRQVTFWYPKVYFQISRGHQTSQQ